MKRVLGTRSRLPLQPLAACLAAALGALNTGASADEWSSASSTGSATTVRADRARPSLPHALAPAHPTGGDVVVVVANCNDDGAGSLRDAFDHAVTDETIDLTTLACSTITLTSGALFARVDSLTLRGRGVGRLTIDGYQADNVLRHIGTGYLEVDGVTLANGKAHGLSGGCIYSSGSVSLFDAVLTGCTSVSYGTYDVLGGGVYTKDSLSVIDSTITDNRVEADSAHAYGGGVFVRGRLTVRGSTISNNVASNSGGIASLGNAYIAASTISDNQAHDNAGIALFARYATRPLVLNATTISGNVASNLIGGLGVLAETYIYNSTIANNSDGGRYLGAGLFAGASVHINLESTIVADNLSGTTPSDAGGYSGATLSGAYNLIMTSNLAVPPGTLTADPQLHPLANNGGTTLTHALSATSPAINAGNNTYFGSDFYDQRGVGFARVVGSAADIGAYEYQTTGVTRMVTQCGDSGVGSLRDAVESAASGDTIDLGNVSCSTITLTTGALETFAGNLKLLGPATPLTIDGSNADRIILHEAPGTLYLRNLTLTHGAYTEAAVAAYGGCISSAGRVVLQSSVLSSCHVSVNGARELGGAISAVNLALYDSTIAGSSLEGNGESAYGGGVWAFQSALVRRSTIRDNVAAAANGSGAGGIGAGGYLAIDSSTISGNQANYGGGVLSSYDGVGGTNTVIVNSTISSNGAAVLGGGLFIVGDLDLFNSTVTLNANGTMSAPGSLSGAGLLIDGTANLQSSILFGNVVNTASGPTSDDISGNNDNALLTGANNLIGLSELPAPPDTINADPLLAPLQDNGGPTHTHALRVGSPAIDAGNNTAALDTDQRGGGFARVFGAAADIGAYELQDRIFADGFDIQD